MRAGTIGPDELSDLVARQGELKFRFGIADLPRIQEVAAPVPDADEGGAGQLEAVVGFAGGLAGLPEIRVEVRGSVMLPCQRCLEPVRWPVDLAARLQAVAPGADPAGVADPLEIVPLPEEGLDPIELVEDEVLASLPLAPMHPEGTCAGPTGSDVPLGVSGRAEVNKPFAELAALVASGVRRADD